MQEDETSHKENTSQSHSQDNEWIKEVARQSWEPELLISGAAAFASLSLPGLLKSLFATYRIDLMIGSSYLDLMFPSLIYAVFASVAQLLILTFFVHFSMRAFWVGMVGLLSVYPGGIRFNEIKNINEYGQEYLRTKLTSVDEFVLRLDKWCSLLFSTSFLIVLFSLGIAFIYFLFFLLVSVGKLFAPIYWINTYESLILTFLGSFFLLFALISAILKNKKNNPKAQKWSFLINYRLGQAVFPLLSKVTPYLLYTFSSNLSRKRLTINSVVAGLLFALLLLFNLNERASQGKSKNGFETRGYYTQRSAEHLLTADYYENLRNTSLPVEQLTVQSDIIKEPFLKLFIAYPKRIDYMMSKVCKPLPKDKNLSKIENRKRKAAHYLNCFKDFYQVFINGELQKEISFLFHEKMTNQSKGIIAYIPINHLKNGSKNLLQIKTKVPNPMIKKKQRKPFAYTLPFWYFKDK